MIAQYIKEELSQDAIYLNSWDKLYKGNIQDLPWLYNPNAEEVLDFISNIKKGDKFLDYGCGNGRYAQCVAKKSATVVCADISREAISLARRKLSGTFIEASKPLQVPGNDFDYALLWGVLHHIQPNERNEFMEDLLSKLKPGGRLLVGGWSSKDVEFCGKPRRLSNITGQATWEIDSFLQNYGLENYSLEIKYSHFNFIEAIKLKQRIFSVYHFRKK
jgi:SAM-dependent methyltransferase